MFRHVVLFRVRDEVTDPEVSDAMAMLRRLGTLPGVTGWTVALSLDERKGRVIVEDGTFLDQASFVAWRARSEHEIAAFKMTEIADWLVGDWQEHAVGN
ncbi:Dabb family protein [Microbacterium sp. LMI1-1-1.1]|uniref:Dabb family protein n=1 Tax=Microbacterium sp. LMI1-1-1.1 TaxID=3135223 RepID=UPI00346781CD